MRSPTNTETQARKYPDILLAEAMLGDTNGMIERQEARGQQEFVKSETLPTNRDRNYVRDNTFDVLAKFGLEIIGPVPNDPLFQYVKLPPGWTKRSTDHSMWSWLYDDKDRKRAAIFYKAAFYDRSAHISLICRYKADRVYHGDDYRTNIRFAIWDGDTIIHEVKSALKDDGTREFYQALDAEEKAIRAELLKRFPNAVDPAAYWND